MRRKNETVRAWYDRNRAWYNELKSFPCTDCNEIYPIPCMQFDHTRGKKIGNVSEMVRSKSRKDVQKEIDKCDLVCANCHAIRTAKRRISKER